MSLFIDSDVIISSLLSDSGAAHLVIHHSQLNPIISSISVSELRIVTDRLGIESGKLEALIASRFSVVPLTKNLQIIKKEYEKFVSDNNDAHIVAGAHSAGSKYLISYNIKHFKTDALKNELDILVMTPGIFMQFLRSN